MGAPVGRREFLAGVGGLGAGLGLGALSHWFPLPPSDVKPAWSPCPGAIRPPRSSGSCRSRARASSARS